MAPNMARLQNPGSECTLLEGRYANYFKVGFNDQEVVIDFGQHHGAEETLMHTRIVICHAYLSGLLKMLDETKSGIDKNLGARKR